MRGGFMRIKRVKLKNFLSHKDTEIMFNNENLILIQGLTESGRSNGAGKTAIVSAILFALTKDINKNVNIKSLIRHGSKSAEVELELDNVLIRREIKKTVNTTYIENGVEYSVQKNNELDKIIKDRFHIVDNMLDHQYSSELNTRYMFYTPTRKLNFFEEVLKLNEQNEMYKKINKYKSDIEKEITQVSTEINMLEDEISRTKSMILDNYTDQKMYFEEQIRVLTDKRNNIINEIDSIKSDIVSIKNKYLYKKDELKDKYKKMYLDETNEYTSKLDSLNKLVTELNSKIDLLYTQKSELSVWLQTELNKLTDTDIQKLEFEINSLYAKINEYTELSELDVCPLCKREIGSTDIEMYINEINKLKSCIEEKKQVKDKLVAELNSKKLELNNVYTQKIECINKEITDNQNVLKSYTNEINKLQYVIKDIETKYMTEYKLKLNDMLNEIKSKEQLVVYKNNELNSVNTQISKYEQDLRNVVNSINNLTDNDKLVSLSDLLNNKKTERSTLKYNYDIVELWSKIFSPKSKYRTSIIKQYLDVLSIRVDLYANKLFEEDIKFEFVLDENKGIITEYIYRDGYINEFHMLSQGEKKKIEISVLLAFYEIIANSNINNLQVLLLDEVLDGLDNDSISAMLELIKQFADTYNVQVLFISNIDIDKSMFDRIITVTKENGVSVVR